MRNSKYHQFSKEFTQIINQKGIFNHCLARYLNLITELIDEKTESSEPTCIIDLKSRAHNIALELVIQYLASHQLENTISTANHESRSVISKKHDNSWAFEELDIPFNDSPLKEVMKFAHIYNPLNRPQTNKDSQNIKVNKKINDGQPKQKEKSDEINSNHESSSINRPSLLNSCSPSNSPGKPNRVQQIIKNINENVNNIEHPQEPNTLISYPLNPISFPTLEDPNARLMNNRPRKQNDKKNNNQDTFHINLLKNRVKSEGAFLNKELDDARSDNDEDSLSQNTITKRLKNRRKSNQTNEMESESSRKSQSSVTRHHQNILKQFDIDDDYDDDSSSDEKNKERGINNNNKEKNKTPKISNIKQPNRKGNINNRENVKNDSNSMNVKQKNDSKKRRSKSASHGKQRTSLPTNSLTKSPVDENVNSNNKTIKANKGRRRSGSVSKASNENKNDFPSQIQKISKVKRSGSVKSNSASVKKSQTNNLINNQQINKITPNSRKNRRSRSVSSEKSIDSENTHQNKNKNNSNQSRKSRNDPINASERRSRSVKSARSNRNKKLIDDNNPSHVNNKKTSSPSITSDIEQDTQPKKTSKRNLYMPLNHPLDSSEDDEGVCHEKYKFFHPRSLGMHEAPIQNKPMYQKRFVGEIANHNLTILNKPIQNTKNINVKSASQKNSPQQEPKVSSRSNSRKNSPQQEPKVSSRSNSRKNSPQCYSSSKNSPLKSSSPKLNSSASNSPSNINKSPPSSRNASPSNSSLSRALVKLSPSHRLDSPPHMQVRRNNNATKFCSPRKSPELQNTISVGLQSPPHSISLPSSSITQSRTPNGDINIQLKIHLHQNNEISTDTNYRYNDNYNNSTNNSMNKNRTLNITPKVIEINEKEQSKPTLLFISQPLEDTLPNVIPLLSPLSSSANDSSESGSFDSNSKKENIIFDSKLSQSSASDEGGGSGSESGETTPYENLGVQANPSQGKNSKNSLIPEYIIVDSSSTEKSSNIRSPNRNPQRKHHAESKNHPLQNENSDIKRKRNSSVGKLLKIDNIIHTSSKGDMKRNLDRMNKTLKKRTADIENESSSSAFNHISEFEFVPPTKFISSKNRKSRHDNNNHLMESDCNNIPQSSSEVVYMSEAVQYNSIGQKQPIQNFDSSSEYTGATTSKTYSTDIYDSELIQIPLHSRNNDSDLYSSKPFIKRYNDSQTQTMVEVETQTDENDFDSLLSQIKKIIFEVLVVEADIKNDYISSYSCRLALNDQMGATRTIKSNHPFWKHKFRLSSKDRINDILKVSIVSMKKEIASVWLPVKEIPLINGFDTWLQLTPAEKGSVHFVFSAKEDIS
ncbi:hypothetical protein TRFO_08165 [Tritrichomonas foetus]|uniref:C2 domain-containing protein n=1 Tax=Tritrichomonas foetus TaxID=1144522 RepID=A0A1J4JRJ0_9EUKA|nr:hypothetical protein TRFO_08165 [Tritrichomonas foetus]|eukprot:OHS99868.1 hypothetical protein TRFO_08165 [Tritrichomonas foetus]